MTTVLLEGLGAGLTTEQYEEKRALDCRVARMMGHQTAKVADEPVDAVWVSTIDGGYALRDEEGGVPFFSFDMNNAILVLNYTMKQWRYAARQVYFLELQKLGCFGDEGDMPPYPDVLTSLIDDFPVSICKAFIGAWQTFCDINFDPVNSPASEAIETEERTIIDAGGNERKTVGLKLTGKPPWVHTE